MRILAVPAGINCRETVIKPIDKINWKSATTRITDLSLRLSIGKRFLVKITKRANTGKLSKKRKLTIQSGETISNPTFIPGQLNPKHSTATKSILMPLDWVLSIVEVCCMVIRSNWLHLRCCCALRYWAPLIPVRIDTYSLIHSARLKMCVIAAC